MLPLENTLQIFSEHFQSVVGHLTPFEPSPGVLGISRCYLTHRVTAQVWRPVRIKYLRPSCLLLQSTQYLLQSPLSNRFKVTLVTMRKQCTDSIECELSCVDKMGDRVLEFNQHLLHCGSPEYLLDTSEIHTGFNNVKAMWAVLLCG